MQQKALGVATTALVLIIIARLTLAPMGGIVSRHLDICLPCGDAGWADFLLNVSLFVPLGIGLRLAGLERRTAALLAIGLSVGIETLQYYVIPGRESDTSDIIANSAGAILGIATVEWRRLLVTPGDRAARRLSLCTAAFICVTAGVVQWALVPTFPHTIYFPQIAPDLPGYDQFHGQVLDATLDGVPLKIGRMSIEASGIMHDSLIAGDAVIAATMRPLPGQHRLAPITDAHDQNRRELFFLARRGHDVLFRVHRRSDTLGVHTPSASLASVFPPELASGDTVAIQVTIGIGAITLDAVIHSGSGVRMMHRRVGQGIWDLWRLLIPDTGLWAAHPRATTVLSLLLLFGPLGYWAGRALRPDAPLHARLAVGLAIVVPVAASLAIIPWVAQAPAGPVVAWVTVVVALVVALGLGRWSAAELDR